jgi:pimeloyl-ACP methyl ester carboxylesterase
MFRTKVVSATLFLAALLIAGALFIDRRADLRAARTEAAFPPLGQIVTVEGREVHVVMRGAGPDLVLIHGAGANAREFTGGFADALADRFRLFIVDRPGMGWSEHADPAYARAYTTEAESPADQARILSAAVAGLGAKTPLVLGHSFGASVALAWGLDHPASGVIVVSGATMPWPGPLDPYYRVLGSAPGSALLAPAVAALVSDSRIDDVVTGVFAPQVAPENYAREAATRLGLRTESLRANARQVKSLRPHIVTMSDRYRGLRLPVEIIHGDADTITPLEVHSRPLSQTLPDAALAVLPGIGHMPHHAARGDVIAAIERAAARAGLR